MPRRADTAVFAAAFVGLSIVLGWAFWTAFDSVNSANLGFSMLAVPMLSAMLASLGFSWRRKLAYASATIGIYLLTGILADLSGLSEIAAQQFVLGGPLPSLLVVLFMAWLVAFPFVMIVLFVGRKPSALWSRPTRDGDERPR